jgi:hypothetical protein
MTTSIPANPDTDLIAKMILDQFAALLSGRTKLVGGADLVDY